jgi:predicted nucleic acid-binding protein
MITISTAIPSAINEHGLCRYVLLDCFHESLDLAHEKVKTFTRATRPEVICTTEEVLTEYLNYFAGWGPHFRRKAALNVQNMLGNRTVRIVAQTADSFRSGFDLYRARLDKGYSLTDCISMQTMRSESIPDALTEGFRAVLRDPQPTG